MAHEPDPVRNIVQEVFRPWRSELAYAALLIVLSTCFLWVCALETNQILESQIALGIDPAKAAAFVSLAIVAEFLVLAFWAVRARRSLLATGELRFSGSTLILSKGAGAVSRNVDDLTGIASYTSGASARMRFPTGAIKLPGQWLPPGWRRTWRGWRAPSGAAMWLSRKSHPLLAAIRGRRPDLKPRLAGIGVELLAGLLFAIVPRIGSYPLYVEARRMANQPSVDDIAMRDFQEGRYLQACEAYRRALPNLRRDLYGSQHAAEFLWYCGDPKGAVQAFVGFEGQPFWPSSPDPARLAQLRISNGRYVEAENLLQGNPSYLLYVALAEQGQRKEAEEVLEQVAGREGLARVLLLRHRNQEGEARAAADSLCSAFVQHRPWTPSWLARVFESCILSGGASKPAEDSRFNPAIRALPGLRAELVQFTEREAPDLAEELKSIMQQRGHDK